MYAANFSNETDKYHINNNNNYNNSSRLEHSAELDNTSRLGNIHGNFTLIF